MCENGQWSCEQKPCPATCSVVSYQHFTTFDGLQYTYEGGECEHVLVQVRSRTSVVPPKKLSFRLGFSLSDMTNYKSAFGKVCRIKNRHTLKVCRFLIWHTLPNADVISSYHAVKYAELRIGILLEYCRFLIRHTLKVCRFLIRHTMW